MPGLGNATATTSDAARFTAAATSSPRASSSWIALSQGGF